MRLIIDDASEGIRIDSYLAEILPNLSRSQIQKGIKQGNVKINNSPIKPSHLLKDGDIIEFEELTQESINIKAENIPIDVVWEDENMAVINKPSGMLTHPTTIEKSGTLVNALLYRFGNELSDLNGEFRRGIVHRLDRNTSGLIMIAKNNKTHEYLVNEMREKNFSKKYLAIVRGVINENEFKINKPIGRDSKHPEKQCITPDGKESLTIVHVLKRLESATLVELTLITGRTHQIRVHMASIGHPVFNDTLYGFGKIKIKTEEQVLQSYKLEFNKPFNGERIALEIPPDEKIKKVLNALGTKPV